MTTRVVEAASWMEWVNDGILLARQSQEVGVELVAGDFEGRRGLVRETVGCDQATGVCLCMPPEGREQGLRTWRGRRGRGVGDAVDQPRSRSTGESKERRSARWPHAGPGHPGAWNTNDSRCPVLSEFFCVPSAVHRRLGSVSRRSS